MLNAAGDIKQFAQTKKKIIHIFAELHITE